MKGKSYLCYTTFTTYLRDFNANFKAHLLQQSIESKIQHAYESFFPVQCKIQACCLHCGSKSQLMLCYSNMSFFFLVFTYTIQLHFPVKICMLASTYKTCVPSKREEKIHATITAPILSSRSSFVMTPT